ncbi:MAG: conjugative transposon protein TraM [Sphingobacteriales bacterium]|nr:conjugative transposon protein TraM [Sphingobacteriales bacterium]OJV98829.1 MAG: conjugative transposon protein TraM [Sphingobacteriales bacterium 44-61]
MNKMENVNEKKRKQRFYLMAPLLVLPFLTFGFWALGGGKANSTATNENLVKHGLKIELPNARVNDKPMDKLSYYDQAYADSLKLVELKRHDPYYKNEDTSENYSRFSNPAMFAGNGNPENPSGQYGYDGLYTAQTSNEAKVYERLHSLNAILSQDNAPATTLDNQIEQTARQPLDKADIDRLEKLLKMTQETKREPDPEMQELSGMLEKVLDIQHPERVQEKLRKTSTENKGKIFSVSATNTITPISVLENENKQPVSTGFFSLEEAPEVIKADYNTISAVVHESQTLVSGSIVKLRLSSDIYINGELVPKDNFVFGIANLNGERLSIVIENIRYGQAIYPVKLRVFDLDGIDGIHIPGAISRDVAKQSGNEALQGVNVSTIDPSLGAQAASAGIELGKSLIGKKVKLTKVTVKAGYKVILKDLNQQD